MKNSELLPGMPAPAPSAADDKLLRWTLTRAAREFGLTRQTLSTRMAALGTAPGPDETFSTREICRAVFGDLIFEQTRETALRADLLEVKLAMERKGVIGTEIVFRLWAAVASRIKRVIETSELSNGEKDSIYREIQAFKREDLLAEANEKDGEEPAPKKKKAAR